MKEEKKTEEIELVLLKDRLNSLEENQTRLEKKITALGWWIIIMIILTFSLYLLLTYWFYINTNDILKLVILILNLIPGGT